MTLKSKYFQADRLMSRLPFSVKSPKELRKIMLKILKGGKVLFSLSVEQNIDIKKFPKELFGVLLKNCAVVQFINRLFRGWV